MFFLKAFLIIMNLTELKNTIQTIVAEATKLKNKHTDETDAPVNYACIFSHSEDEFGVLIKLASQFGSIIKETPTGPIFLIQTISTVSGNLRILKIRKSYENKPQLGYVDFTIKDYEGFKKKHISQANFTLTIREGYEMIGIKDASYNVFAYFAYPPLNKQLNIK